MRSRIVCPLVLIAKFLNPPEPGVDLAHLLNRELELRRSDDGRAENCHDDYRVGYELSPQYHSIDFGQDFNVVAGQVHATRIEEGDDYNEHCEGVESGKSTLAVEPHKLRS